jgi:hypothetical protein
VDFAAFPSEDTIRKLARVLESDVDQDEQTRIAGIATERGPTSTFLVIVEVFAIQDIRARDPQ